MLVLPEKQKGDVAMANKRVVIKRDTRSPEECLQELRRLIGLGSVRSLQCGSTLHVWRRTSPHNVWVENKHGTMLWHSNTDNGNDASAIKRMLDMFQLAKNAPRLIATGCPEIVGGDEGAPEESQYHLKKKFCRH